MSWVIRPAASGTRTLPSALLGRANRNGQYPDRSETSPGPPISPDRTTAWRSGPKAASDGQLARDLRLAVGLHALHHVAVERGSDRCRLVGARSGVVDVHVARRHEDEEVARRLRAPRPPDGRAQAGGTRRRSHPIAGRRRDRTRRARRGRPARTRHRRGRAPVSPRARQVTSCPVPTASLATAPLSQAVPPSTRSLMASAHTAARLRATAIRQQRTSRQAKVQWRALACEV